MSLQELDSRSSDVIAQAKDGESDNLPPRLRWFRRAFPHFFTPGIVQARKASAEKNPQEKKKPVTWRSVARLDRGEHTHVSLHINLKNHAFRLVPIDSVDGVGWPIAEATLLHVTAHRSEWVIILLSDKSSIRLHRGELLAAYNFLKSQV